MPMKRKVKNHLISSGLIVAVSLLSACSSGGSSNADERSSVDSNGSIETISENTDGKSESGENDNSAIDAKLKASVKCTVTDVDENEISIEEINDSEALITIGAQSYFYFNESVTVTNYSDEAGYVYVAYRLVDDNGRVFDTQNFREIVGAGETLTIDDNTITQPATDIVVRGNLAAKETSFDCPVVEASLSGA
jgi:hypothetical protein